jgi:hypothetical protein
LLPNPAIPDKLLPLAKAIARTLVRLGKTRVGMVSALAQGEELSSGFLTSVNQEVAAVQKAHVNNHAGALVNCANMMANVTDLNRVVHKANIIVSEYNSQRKKKRRVRTRLPQTQRDCSACSKSLGCCAFSKTQRGKERCIQTVQGMHWDYRHQSSGKTKQATPAPGATGGSCEQGVGGCSATHAASGASLRWVQHHGPLTKNSYALRTLGMRHGYRVM